MSQQHKSKRVIKRYDNRKLYDTLLSCYITLEHVAKMVNEEIDLIVLDNKTKTDITAVTLTQIIFENERKSADKMPLLMLKEILRNGNGGISDYLAKLGVFTEDQFVNIARRFPHDQENHKSETTLSIMPNSGFIDIIQTPTNQQHAATLEHEVTLLPGLN